MATCFTGDRVVQVTPGGDHGQQQVEPDGRGDEFGVRGGQAHPPADVSGHDFACDAVVTRPALADVVQQGREQQQVRPGHFPGQRGGMRGRLGQVTVHGEGMQRVALGPVPDPLPVRDQRRHQAFGVERLPDADRGLAGAQQGEQRVPGRRGPGDGQRRAFGQPVQGPRRQRQAGLRGRGGRAQDERGIADRVGGAGQHHLAVLFHHSVRERAALGPAAAQPAPAYPVRLAEGVINRVRDGTRGPRQHPEQHVPVEQAERAGHLVLLLKDQPVQAAPGDLVQRVPGVQDLLVGGADLGAGRGRHPRGRDRLDRVHVPQAATGLLQVGLEQEGQFAAHPGAFIVVGVQFGQPRGRGRAPVLQGARPQPLGEIRIAGHVPGGQQPHGDLEVGARHPPGLRHGTDRVVELGAGVPDGIPDPVRDTRDVVAAAVQQQHVQVAARQ